MNIIAGTYRLEDAVCSCCGQALKSHGIIRNTTGYPSYKLTTEQIADLVTVSGEPLWKIILHEGSRITRFDLVEQLIK